MRVHNFLIGLLMFGLFLTILLSVAVDLNQNVGTEINDTTYAKLNNLSSKINPVVDVVEDVKDKSLGGEDVVISEGSDADSYEDLATKSGVFAIASMPFRSYGALTDILDTIRAELGLNVLFTTIFISSIIIIISIIFISSILKNRL